MAAYLPLPPSSIYIPQNLPIITADDENNLEDDDDFLPLSFGPRNLDRSGDVSIYHLYRYPSGGYYGDGVVNSLVWVYVFFYHLLYKLFSLCCKSFYLAQFFNCAQFFDSPL